jgi:hypothetical protein
MAAVVQDVQIFPKEGVIPERGYGGTPRLAADGILGPRYNGYDHAI